MSQMIFRQASHKLAFADRNHRHSACALEGEEMPLSRLAVAVNCVRGGGLEQVYLLLLVSAITYLPTYSIHCLSLGVEGWGFVCLSVYSLSTESIFGM